MTDFCFLLWNNMPWVWLVLAIVFILIESLTMALTTIWFAIGAFIMIFLAFLPIPFPAQIVIFAIISCALLIFTRPLALKKFNAKNIATNANSLIGTQVIVQDAITEFQKGSVKINGITWNAEEENGQSVEPGTKCEVTEIKGNTLVLRRSL
ncbi:MAG: NfeD family protein [Treponema sp.]|nr:NfeD family protein [Treponema sp.]